MLLIAHRSQKSLKFICRSGSNFSQFAKTTKRSRTHRLEFLFSLWHSRCLTVASLLQLHHQFSTIHRGTKRSFCETPLQLLNDKAPSNSKSDNSIELQFPAIKSSTPPPYTVESPPRQHHQDLSLDKFTHFALNSRAIPLGSMQEENWLDVLDAIDAWLNIGGGFAIDSAERLVERLMNEQAGSFSEKKAKSSSSYSNRSTILADFQSDILNAWIQIFIESKGNSRLAIHRAEQALFRLLKFFPMVDESMIQSRFPTKEYISIIEGYLQLHANYSQGAEKAGTLLLRFSSVENDKWDINSEECSALIGQLFERCVDRLLTIDSANPLVIQLLKTMTTLKEAGVYPEMKIVQAAQEKILGNIPQSEGKGEKMIETSMSPFEKETADSRLLDLLKSATKDDKNTVNDHLRKLKTSNPKNDAIVALIEYFVRIGDSDSASHWLQKLEVSFLMSSWHLVERVLVSWMEQMGSRDTWRADIPWRADEVFKAVTRKIRDHDVNFVMSAKSFELIVGIWNLTEDLSASKKIMDWYSQMNAWMIKPSTTTLKITLRALSTVNIENSFNQVSHDILQDWDNFGSKDKDDIGIAILELISLQKLSIEMITTLIDRFRNDEVFSAKSLLHHSLSSIQKDASPTDVMSIFNSFDITAESIDLSCYAKAIDTLFNLNDDSRREIEFMHDRAMRRIMKSLDSYDPNDISEFLYSITTMYTHRKLYSEAETLLKNAEDLFLFKDYTPKGLSLIPLKCYKKMIVRNWYTTETAKKVEESFEILMVLYRSGYSNLQPDCDLYTAYIDARVLSGKKVEHIFDEMIQYYNASENREIKPQAKVFNTILLSWAQNKRRIPNLYDKSMKMLNLMHDLDVRPDIKTFNLILKNAIKENNKDTFKRSTILTKLIEESTLKPDTYTLHMIIDACGSAPSSNRELALQRCLSTFGEIRKQKLVGPITYGILSKVIYRLISRDDRADKIGESLLSMCCEDGMLTPEVRGRLKSMMSSSVWEKVYNSHSSKRGMEPAHWSRNLPIK